MGEALLELEIQLTFQDYLRANYWYCWRKRKWSIILLILALLATGFAAFDLIADPYAPVQDLWLLIAVWGLVVYRAAYPYWGSRRYAKSAKTLFIPRHFTFSENGLTMKGPTASSSIDWINFYRSYETGTAFLLFTSLSQFITIPKRCLMDTRGIEAFREMLQRCLPQSARLR